DVTAGADGIAAITHGNLAITTNGDVRGNYRYGIYATNSHGDLVIGSGPDALITGRAGGVWAKNEGGSLGIDVQGDVIGLGDPEDRFVYANGIYAVNDGSGDLTINAGGTVSGQTADGIHAWNREGGRSLTVT